MQYAYEFTKKFNRENVDLRDFNSAIKTSIEQTLPTAKNIVIRERYFVFYLDSETSKSQLRVLGRKIVKSDNALADFITTYHSKTKSKQLFHRIKSIIDLCIH